MKMKPSFYLPPSEPQSSHPTAAETATRRMWHDTRLWPDIVKEMASNYEWCNPPSNGMNYLVQMGWVKPTGFNAPRATYYQSYPGGPWMATFSCQVPRVFMKEEFTESATGETKEDRIEPAAASSHGGLERTGTTLTEQSPKTRTDAGSSGPTGTEATSETTSVPPADKAAANPFSRPHPKLRTTLNEFLAKHCLDVDPYKSKPRWCFTDRHFLVAFAKRGTSEYMKLEDCWLEEG
ncbi:hypothetical protein K458DRAFT_428423 [Lentithecium fluviatile CBS 122367]|uniref:Uncharacterized protein n=1 Tax=Lentithecium fluviatile CBS 122367 TaxID=1168545 RepID=A0A6G1JEJ0_9PLEO|nr:hypothetical protein K458DRAFT_428423 [Lentithecium fluviatile CBS 122367]